VRNTVGLKPLLGPRIQNWRQNDPDKFSLTYHGVG